MCALRTRKLREIRPWAVNRGTLSWHLVAMNRRLLVASSLASLAGAIAIFACVGDTPVTPTDAGPDTGGGDVNNKPDAVSDAATPLLTCQGSETLETFDDPMNLPSNADVCFQNFTPVPCSFAGGTGVQYASQALSAVATTGVQTYALGSRAHEAFGPVEARVTEAFVTYEVSVSAFIGDSGWHGFGCLFDQDDLNEAGTTATSISRLDIATTGTAAAAFTYVNGTHTGQTAVPLTGYSSTGPMTVTMRIDRRTSPKATVTLSSTAGNGTVNLSPTFGADLALWCGAAHEATNGVTKVTISKIRYARCLKP